MPTMDEDGAVYGYVVRKLDNQNGPKTLSIFDKNVGAWYHCESSDELMIVEDQISALRASRYMNAVALMGTTMTDAVLNTIRLTPIYQNIFIALDADAFPVAIKMAHRCRPYFKSKVIKLSKDIKDMEEDELVEMLFQAGAEFYKGD
jgi:DNA primase